MLRYVVHDFPYGQVNKLINATKKIQVNLNCATEESFCKVYAAKRILNIQIEACRLKRLVRRQLDNILDDEITVTFTVS